MKVPQIFRYNLKTYGFVFLAVRSAADAEKVLAIVGVTDAYTAMTLTAERPPFAADYGFTVEYISLTAAREAFTVGGCRCLYTYTADGLKDKMLIKKPRLWDGAYYLILDFFDVLKEKKKVNIFDARRLTFPLQNIPENIQKLLDKE